MQCVPMTCDVLTCDPGMKLVKSDEQCCGECVPDSESCTDVNGNKHSVRSLYLITELLAYLTIW